MPYYGSTMSVDKKDKFPSMIILEDRNLKYIGAGIGLGVNVKLFKRFYFGGDFCFYFTKGERYTRYKEYILEPNNGGRPPTKLPLDYHRTNSKYALARLKIGFMFAQLSGKKRG